MNKQRLSILFIIGGFTYAFFQLAPIIRQNAENRQPPPGGWGQFPRARRWAAGPEGDGPGGPPFRGPRFGGPRFGGRRWGGQSAPTSGFQVPLALVSQFDTNTDGWLNTDERKAAREFLDKERAEGRARRGVSSRQRSGDASASAPGPKLTPAEVKSFPDAPLYEPLVLRTAFLEFEDADWEKELSDFSGTDVDVPAKITIDGTAYPDVGVHLRPGLALSPAGRGGKGSLNLTLDLVNKDQHLYGARALDLLVSSDDPTFVRNALYLQAARDYIPAPKANFLRVVINGESWGVYLNAQHFNKDFVKDCFGTSKGARWNVPGGPNNKGNLAYLGEHTTEYRKFYDLRSSDEKKVWHALINLCRVLNETPPDKLEEELAPILDTDGALKFLALENALANSDGYVFRGGNYNLYRDKEDRFHIIPQDANEPFREQKTPGSPAAHAGYALDPLQGADDSSKPLLNKLLAVPAFRARYLGYVREIAEKWLDWKRIGPLVEQYQTLNAADVKADTENLHSSEAFAKVVTEETAQPAMRGPQKVMPLKDFVEQRQKFLLNHPAIQKALAK